MLVGVDGEGIERYSYGNDVGLFNFLVEYSG